MCIISVYGLLCLFYSFILIRTNKKINKKKTPFLKKYNVRFVTDTRCYPWFCVRTDFNGSLPPLLTLLCPQHPRGQLHARTEYPRNCTAFLMLIYINGFIRGVLMFFFFFSIRMHAHYTNAIVIILIVTCKWK